MRADLTFGGDFLVPATLKHGASGTPKQRGKRVELVEGGRQNSPGFERIRFEGRGCSRLLGKDQGRTPIVGAARVQFQTRTKRGSTPVQADQHVLSAIDELAAITETERATLFHARAPEGLPRGSKLGFAKNESCMRTRAERACGKPNGGDAAAWSRIQIVHLPGEDELAGTAQFLGVGECRGRGCRNIGGRTGAPRAVREIPASPGPQRTGIDRGIGGRRRLVPFHPWQDRAGGRS